MKLRFAVAAFLLVIAIALPIVGVVQRGAPWGFRGHQAVLISASGNVELTASEARRAKEKREDPSLKPVPGLFLDDGDEVRASRYSEALLRFPAGDVVVGDAARLVIGKKGVALARGLVEVRLPKGSAGPFDVKVDGMDATFIVRGGPEGAIVRVLADGKAEARAFVKSGTAEGVSSGGDQIAEGGRVLVIGSDNKARAETAPGVLVVNATCDGKKLAIDAPGGTQIFAAGGLHYPENGKVSLDVAGKSELPVLGRDIAGNLSRSTVKCVASTAAKPAPKPPPPPPPVPSP